MFQPWYIQIYNNKKYFIGIYLNQFLLFLFSLKKNLQASHKNAGYVVIEEEIIWLWQRAVGSFWSYIIGRQYGDLYAGIEENNSTGIDLQTKHLLKLAILESGKKKNPLPQWGKFTEQKHLCVYGRGKKCIPTPNLLTSY